MPLTDKTITEFRLAVESMRAYIDQTIKQIDGGIPIDAAAAQDIKGTLALCKGQVEAIGTKMDTEDPALADAVKVAAAAAGVDLAPDAKA